MLMIISGQFHIDPESLSHWVEWDQKVISRENNPNHDSSLWLIGHRYLKQAMDYEMIHGKISRDYIYLVQ